ncbi:MAG: ribonuclease E/G, partial [Candidatus Heimdallarchaeota archaeon]
TVISLPGNYCILELGSSFVRVSKKIQGENRRRLHEIGKKLLPDGFGMIIRTSALQFGETELESEIKMLVEKWNTIQTEPGISDGSNRIISGEKVSELVIGFSSKQKLDELIGAISPVVTNYHMFKSYSMASGFVLEFASHFSEKLEINEVHDTLYKMIKKRDFRINNHLKAEFHYLDGTDEEVHLGNINENNGLIVSERQIENNEMEFPSFDVKAGDIMQVCFKVGSWSMHYKFLNSGGNLIGEWLRIVGSLDIAYRGRIRAYDMGMHLFKDGEGNVTHHVDEHSRDDLLTNGVITKELDNKLASVLASARSSLQASEDRILIEL